VSRVPRDRLGAVLVGHFLDRWERDEGLMVLLRTGVTNDAAADRLRTVFATQILPLVGGEHTRAGLVATQVLGMALCRYVLKLPPVVRMSREETVDWLGPTVQRYLTGRP
jgi:hypothetical protein